MTPQQLRAWRDEMDWTQPEAAQRLGLAERTYRYLEEGTTSTGGKRDAVPLYIELAIAELRRRHAPPVPIPDSPKDARTRAR
jgi:DNA-binding XRE family transcriptional regulator